MKCSASEALSLYGMLRHFFDCRLPTTSAPDVDPTTSAPDVDHRIANNMLSFRLACKAVDILLLCKRLRAEAESEG